jgi:hypothetical protein
MDSKELTAIRKRVRTVEATQDDARKLLIELERTRRECRELQAHNRYLVDENNAMAPVIVWMASLDETNIMVGSYGDDGAVTYMCSCCGLEAGEPTTEGHDEECAWRCAREVFARPDF